MRLYSENKQYKLYQGNMLDMLETIGANSIDSIVTDPPYELNFMSKEWDNAGVSFQKETWEKCYEVLKPGGYLLAFGGSRTFHRIACAIEDAGFEIRDTIMWLYGSGFPKSMNIGLAVDKKNGIESKVVGKAYKGSSPLAGNHKGTWADNQKDGEYEIKEAQNKWKGWGTALKPSFEPIIVARKPFKGSLVDNVIENGVGGINIDECRVEAEERTIPIHSQDKKEDNTMFNLHSTIQHERIATTQGRFPANTILTYDETDFDEVCGGFPNKNRPNGSISKRYKINNQVYGDYGYCNTWKAYQDSGSASRYFYCAKASKKDRDEGLEDFEEQKVNDGRKKDVDNAFQRGTTLRHNTHCCVKPTTLMQYLVRLVSPKGATILDPFMGSGSTGKAIMYENKERNANYKFIGIEQNEEYCRIAKARIEYVINLKEENKIDKSQITIDEFMEV